MKIQLCILSILLALSFIGCTAKDQRQAAASQITITPLASPPPTVKSTATPELLTASERIDAIRSLMNDAPMSANETREVLAHLEILAKGKDARGKRLAKLVPGIKVQMNGLIAAEQNQEAASLCADRMNDGLSAIKKHLNETLHDPSSLQDMRATKCVPIGKEGATANIRASYRAKNALGALVLGSDVFFVHYSKSDGKYLALPTSAVNELK